MISTVYHTETLSRDKKIWKKETKTGRKTSTVVQQTVPEAVIEYNKYMNGVDKANQCMELFNIKRNSRKWDRKLTLHMF